MFVVIFALLHSLISSLGAAAATPPKLPLRTSSRWILDSNNATVSLNCVNWYGAHLPFGVPNGLSVQPIATIATIIASLGFNCVRLTFSTQLVVENAMVRIRGHVRRMHSSHCLLP